MSPFEMDPSCCPKKFLDLLSDSANTSNAQKAQELKQLLEGSVEDPKFSYGVAKARKSSNVSMKYKPQKYKAGDKLWIKNI